MSATPPKDDPTKGLHPLTIGVALALGALGWAVVAYLTRGLP